MPQLALVLAWWHMSQPVTLTVTESVNVWASEALTQNLTHTLTVMVTPAVTWPGILTETLAGQESLLAPVSVSEALTVAGLEPALARVSKLDVILSHEREVATAVYLYQIEHPA